MSTDTLLRDMGYVADGLVHYVHNRDQMGCHALLSTLSTHQLHALAVVFADREAELEIDGIAVQRAVEGDPPEGLNRVERDAAIFELARLGYNDKAIGQRIGISHRTVGRIRRGEVQRARTEEAA